MKEVIRQILREEIDSFDNDILKFLRRHGDSRVQNFGDGFEVQTIAFNVGSEWYSITSFMSKKEITHKLLQMLDDSDVVSLGEYNPNVLDTDRQKVVRTIRYYIDNVIKK